MNGSYKVVTVAGLQTVVGVDSSVVGFVRNGRLVSREDASATEAAQRASERFGASERLSTADFYRALNRALH